MDHIATNIIANILGLGWAATPAGLKAMESLQELEEERRQMRASSSWRVTAPLRMASAGLQRLRKGAQTSRRK